MRETFTTRAPVDRREHPTIGRRMLPPRTQTKENVNTRKNRSFFIPVEDYEYVRSGLPLLSQHHSEYAKHLRETVGFSHLKKRRFIHPVPMKVKNYAQSAGHLKVVSVLGLESET